LTNCQQWNLHPGNAFHLVAQHRNFTRAAAILFITPSGLSVLIRKLERQLGFRVFDRTTRKVVLTGQGRELLALTRPVLKALEEGMSRIEQAVKRKNRRISIGATPWVAGHVLPPAIREFRNERPDLDIQLFDGNLSAITRRVAANKLDFALGFGRVDWEGTFLAILAHAGPA
jgi:DNA-binding transcriptional LysR family regulator